MKLNIVVLGLSITSSWGNGHATTYRALLSALSRRGHRITFLERDVPWFAEHRDLTAPGYCTVKLYSGLPEVPRRFGALIRNADLVVLGSYVPDGSALAEWITSHTRGITAFYDIDTPVTLAGLRDGTCEYIASDLIPRFDLYLSFSGGPVPKLVEQLYGSTHARVLYCSADETAHVPMVVPGRWLLGYLGTYSKDRQSTLERLLIAPARDLPEQAFVVGGASYPDRQWPSNIEYIPHLAADAHASFYCGQRFTLNVTRADMVRLGYSPSVRLFEAAACGVPVISDAWSGIETLFKPGSEILLAREPRDVAEILQMPEDRRLTIAASARARFLRDHTADHRAREFEEYYLDVAAERRRNTSPRMQVVEA